MYEYHLDLALNEDKLIDLQDRQRRNSLRVDGIKERPNETLEDCEKELGTFLKESLGIEEEVVIERTHRKQIRARKIIYQEQLFAEF